MSILSSLQIVCINRILNHAVAILFVSLMVAVSLSLFTVCPQPRSTLAGTCRATGQDVSEALIVESGDVEPAVPLNVVLKVRVLASEPLIEITVVLGKRAGFPAAMFFDRDVTAHVVLPAGLELHRGDLSWKGELRGDQAVEFVATVKAIRDLDGVVLVTAIGHAEGGRVDADQERFHVVVAGGRPRVSLVSPPKPDTVVPPR